MLQYFKLGAGLGWVGNAMPWALLRPGRPGTHYVGGWVGPGTGVGCGKSCPPPHWNKEGENDLINRVAVGRKPFWIDEKKSPALGI